MTPEEVQIFHAESERKSVSHRCDLTVHHHKHHSTHQAGGRSHSQPDDDRGDGTRTKRRQAERGRVSQGQETISRLAHKAKQDIASSQPWAAAHAFVGVLRLILLLNLGARYYNMIQCCIVKQLLCSGMKPMCKTKSALMVSLGTSTHA